MIRFSLILLLFFAQHLVAQTITLPDSATVVKNKVKVARIWFEANDGKRYQQRELHYDRQGRVIMEREKESSYYYLYTYDSKSRMVSSTQRGKDGSFIQKFTTVYKDLDSSRIVSLYTLSDTLHPSSIYFYNSAGKKIREEQYYQGKQQFIYAYTYDNNGKLIARYDSTARERTASVWKNDYLVARRTYDPSGAFLHGYRYLYDVSYRTTSIIDSTGKKSVIHYSISYDVMRNVTEVKRDNTVMPPAELATFKKEFFYAFPSFTDRDGSDEDYGLPVPELVTEHHFTYDKKGNIIRDDLTQKQGSMSQTYVYVYEYEYY